MHSEKRWQEVTITSPPSWGCEKLLYNRLSVWSLCDHVDQKACQPVLACTKSEKKNFWWVKPLQFGGTPIQLSFSMAIPSGFLNGHPVEKQGAAILQAEDQSLRDRMLYVCINNQCLFSSEKLATIFVHIPAALIRCFKVTFTYFLTLNCKRHGRDSFLTHHF